MTLRDKQLHTIREVFDELVPRLGNEDTDMKREAAIDFCEELLRESEVAIFCKITGVGAENFVPDWINVLRDCEQKIHADIHRNVASPLLARLERLERVREAAAATFHTMNAPGEWYSWEEWMTTFRELREALAACEEPDAAS